MSIDIEQAFSDGIERATSTTGIALMGILFVFHSILAVLNRLPLLFETTLRGGDSGTFGLFAGGLLFASLVMIVVSVIVYLGAARLLARPVGELSSIDRDAFTDRLLVAGGSLFVASLIAGITTALGLILIVPGLFLMVSFLFYPFTIAVENRGPIDGLSRSWSLARDNRWELFAMGVIIGIIGFVASIPIGIITLIPVVGVFVNGAFTAVTQLVSLAIIAEVYTSLAGEHSRSGSSDDGYSTFDSDDRWSTTEY